MNTPNLKNRSSEELEQEQTAWRSLIHQHKNYEFFISINTNSRQKPITMNDIINFKNRLKKATVKTVFYGWMNIVQTTSSLHSHMLLKSSTHGKHVPLTEIDLDDLILQLNAEKIQADNLDEYKNEVVKFNLNHMQIVIKKLNQKNNQDALINYFTDAKNMNRKEEYLHIEPIRLSRLNKIASII